MKIVRELKQGKIFAKNRWKSVTYFVLEENVPVDKLNRRLKYWKKLHSRPEAQPKEGSIEVFALPNDWRVG